MNYSLLADEELVNLLIRKEDKLAFREIYTRYWKSIFLHAYRKTNSKEIAEELTQNLFLSLWERRKEIKVRSIHQWLFSAIKYGVINHYKSQIVHEKYVEYEKGLLNESNSSTEQITAYRELSQVIEKGISLLPAKTQMVFKMSRIENRPIKEIAKDLNISEKAVEYHITQSLKIMRVHLKDYLLVIAILFLI
ncbi:RNA polymerase sigma-70 factor [Chondrinema litorale]|uniref:RNA polymerase sigma-70 factor n=1 Tax=Chondrinema litorale TaxID=2994555 RepID=UPI002542CA9C|nr:RNA polymerase sigma-70 factor [Chondrinema litorale]UZR96710.1 RNA polymerase sigma-70 factor [Chondrinema litorale]